MGDSGERAAMPSVEITQLRERISDLERALTDCEAAQEAANRAEERFLRLSNSVKDYALIIFDTENRVVGWNGGAERILGYSEAEILGKPASVFFTPEDLKSGALEAELAKAREQGCAEDERWHVRKDGTRFRASGVLTPVRDNENNLRGYSKVMRDQTARKEAEERLRSSEERFRLFAENVSDYALVPIDEYGNVSGWNTGAERTFGYSEEEILSQPVSRLFTPEDAASGASERDLNQALAGGRSEDERWLVRRDGTRFWARGVTTPMRDDLGQLRGFAKVLRDETAKKEAEEAQKRQEESERDNLRNQIQSTDVALDRTKEELRSLAASLLTAQEEERRRIARELHDDLAQRLAALEMALAHFETEPPGDTAEFRLEVNRLKRLTASLSDELRRVSHQLHPSIVEDLGLVAGLRSLIQEFQHRRSQLVEFEAADVPYHFPAVAAGALYRIVQEALRNIAKHGGTDPVAITIEVTDPQSELRLTIRDSGPGFDPGAVRTERGLGIISMHERAQLIGGTFALESQPGKGTRIQVTVPLSARKLQDPSKTV